MHLQRKRTSLLGMLFCLMTLFLVWQIAFFCIYYHVSTIIDSMTNTSISHGFRHFAIISPIIVFILIQMLFYVLIVLYINFIAKHISHYFRRNEAFTYWFGLLLCVFAISGLLALNSYYFPFSFFAPAPLGFKFIVGSGLVWTAITIIAYANWLMTGLLRPKGGLAMTTAARNDGQVRTVGWVFLLLAAINIILALPSFTQPPKYPTTQPNVIIIGLDSLRPDFTGFYGNHQLHTPNIDAFLNQSVSFSQSYTPLARTFPSWISILTAEHPKHSGARNNLANLSPSKIDTLAKHLQQAGYFSIYASDEKRFSNITQQYGFDELVGPKMGVNDFILGSLTDFPLANLLTKLPIAKYILPYNFANRAAAITYKPEHFSNEVANALRNRPNQPLFLAVHFCLSHWPYIWASDVGKNEIQEKKYQHSIEKIDQQFGQLLETLKQNGLLDNSIIVLLSDHGTALGLPNDTLIDTKNYYGNAALIKNIPVSRLSKASPDSMDYEHDYTVNTAYGQGTNILSLKQYRTLLAFKIYGSPREFAMTRHIDTPVALTDITPTILEILKLPALKKTDGISLTGMMAGKNQKATPRAFFLETGDSLTEIETDHIYIEKVIAKKIGIYRIDPQTTLLIMDPKAEKSINVNKQRAVILGDWLLAHYPASMHDKLVNKKIKSVMIPPYYVLVNMKTGQWTIDLNTPFAKTAPKAILLNKLKTFYGNEI